MNTNFYSVEQTVVRQQKIIDALIDRIERGNDIQNSHFGIFQSAIALQNEVRSKSQRLDDALEALGSTSDALKSANSLNEVTRQNLSDALEVMQEGFALFQDDALVVCNQNFRGIFADISSIIHGGMKFDTYIEALAASDFLKNDVVDEQTAELRNLPFRLQSQPFVSIVLPLQHSRWIQMSARRTKSGNIAVLLTDISDIVRQSLVEKDQLIDQQTRFLQGAFDNLALGVATYSERWRLQLSNRMFADLLELPRTLLTKESSVEKVLMHLRDHTMEHYTQLEDGGGEISRFSDLLRGPIVIKMKSGRILETNFLRHPEGGYIANVRDVTVEFRARESLHESNEELERHVSDRTRELNHANKKLQQQYENLVETQKELQTAKELAEQANQSKTRFLAAASHDLLQPVNAAKLYISMLKTSCAGCVDIGHVDRLDRAFNNMENLLHDLLDISRLDGNVTRFNISNFELNQFLENVAENYSETAKAKGISLKFIAPRIYVRSDQHYLSRIIQNLLANAIQYTPSGGRVLLGVRKRRNHVDIEVYDTGVGIAEDNLVRIFDEFTRIEPEKATSMGVGLGLSIVDQACRQLSHPLDVRSELGKGSMFRVSVPIAKDMPPAKRRGEQRVLPQNVEFDCLIFLIENDHEVLHAMSNLLESWGASVIAVRNTKEAIEQHRELGEVPHLIVSDFQLDNGESGIDTIKALRAETGVTLPAIMISANHSEALERSGELLDFKVLQKPLNLQNLQREIAIKTSFKPKD